MRLFLKTLWLLYKALELIERIMDNHPPFDDGGY
jgi:hypothetical protein